MKKKLAVFIVSLLAFFMVGCTDVSVNVLSYSQGGYNYLQINILLPNGIYTTLDSEHSFETYFNELCAVTDCGFELNSITSQDGYKAIMLVKSYDPATTSDDFLSEFESKVDRGLFFTDVKIKGKNPFDIIRLCEDGTLDKNYNDVSKIFFTIKHGDGDFKPIQEYYPALSGYHEKSRAKKSN